MTDWFTSLHTALRLALRQMQVGSHQMACLHQTFPMRRSCTRYAVSMYHIRWGSVAALSPCTGGVRTGGYPKAAPVAGPLGCQRPNDWDLLWSPARSALKSVPLLKAGQLISAVPGMYCLTKKVWMSKGGRSTLGRLVFWEYRVQANLDLGVHCQLQP